MYKTILAFAVLILLVSPSSFADDRGYLGVTVIGVNNSDTGAEGNGVFIGEIYAGSGAQVAGLEEHDRIAVIDGVSIGDVEDLDAVLAGSRPGQDVMVGVVRGTDSRTFDITLGEGPHPMFINSAKWVVDLRSAPQTGMEMQTLTPQLAAYFGVDAGVLVTEVAEDSAAWDAGVEAGDVLLDVGGAGVGATGDVERFVAERDAGEIVDLTVKRRGRLENVPLTLREGVELRSGSATISLPHAEDGSRTLQLAGNVTIDFASSSTAEFSADSLTFTVADEGEALRTRVLELEEELDRLERELDRIGSE